MSTRPNNELLAVSLKRHLGFTKFYRELHFDPNKQLGWYGQISPNEIVWIGLTLESAKAALESMPIKPNGKTKPLPKTAEPLIIPDRKRRRSKR